MSHHWSADACVATRDSVPAGPSGRMVALSSLSGMPEDEGPGRLLDRYEERIAAIPLEITRVVLFLREDIEGEATAFARRFPTAQVSVLGAGETLPPERVAGLDPRLTYAHAPSLQSRLDVLMRSPRPQLMINHGDLRRAHKLKNFQHLHFFVQPGGLYIEEDLDAIGEPGSDTAGRTVVDLLADMAKLSVVGPRLVADADRGKSELAATCGEITFGDHRAIVERRGDPLLFKLRDWESDEVLTERYGDSWGRLVSQREPFRFESRAEVVSHGDGPIPSGVAEFEVPARRLRCYTQPVCSARQVVRYGEYVVPDTWRHPHQNSLNTRQLMQSSPWFGRYLDRTRPRTTRELAGAYYYLDTELPGHFGHVTTDVLSRVWAWPEALAQDPDLRPLVSVVREGDSIPGFQRQIFESLGIPTDRMEVIGPREEVVVERLYGATPQLENPYYVDPDLGEHWKQVAANLGGESPVRAEKIFIARPEGEKRKCHQADEVLRFFADEGFAVVRPEKYSFADQKALFAQARVIAGFGGSGMFTMMYAPRATVILISGASYNAQNEHLIAAVNGNPLHYFWGESEIAMPERGFNLEAFRSPFDFPLRKHRRDLRRLVR